MEYLYNELDGKENTRIIREYQQNNDPSTAPSFAAGKVDFEHGWYLPAVIQLRMLYSTMPLIEGVLLANGGTILSSGAPYWSSTEVNANSALSIQPQNPDATVSLSSGGKFDSKNKNQLYAVRAIADFSVFQWDTESIADSIQVSPSVPTTYTVTLTEGGVCPFTASIFVDVSPRPQNLSIIPAGPLTICEGNVLQIEAQTSNDGDWNYVWSDLSSGQPFSETSATLLLDADELSPGLHEIQVVVSSDSNDNCADFTTVEVEVLPGPLALATTDDAALCAGGSTTLHAANAGAGASYSWSPANMIQGNANQQNVTTKALTETTVFTLAVDLNGCQNTDEVTVTVNEMPTANAGNDQTIPYNTSTQLTAANVGTGATYQWSPANMIQGNPNQQTVNTIQLTADQTYTLTVDRNGCVDSDDVTVHVREPLTAVAAASPNSICAGESVTLTVVPSTGTGSYNYSWAPANLIATGQNAATATTTGLTTTTAFTCTVYDGNQSFQATVMVTVKPQPEAIATATSTALCEGDNTTLTAADAGAGASYEWTPANMIQGSANQRTVTTVPLTNNQTYTLMVTLNGCQNTDEVTVTVNEYPTADAGVDPSIPYNTATQLTAANMGAGATYQWSPANMIQGNPNQQTINTVQLTADQTYTLTVNRNGCEDTDEVTVHVGESLAATATANPTSVCLGETATLTVVPSSGTGSYNYSWTPANLIATGQNAATATTTELTATTEFTCTVNDNNQTIPTTVTVTVKPQPEAIATATVTSLCEGDNTTLTAADAGTGATYEWTPANMIQGSANQRVVTTTNLTATQTFTLTVTLNGCQNTDEVTVTVNEYPTADAGVDPSIPYNTATQLTAANMGAGATYQWSPANMIQGNPNQQTINTVQLTADQTYTLTVNRNGCEDTDEVTVHVGESLAATATANPTSVCLGETATLTVVPSSGTGSYNYSWTPANLIATGQNAATATTTELTATTEFTCVVNDNNQTIPTTVTVTVKPQPEAIATAMVTSFCEGDNTTLTAADAGAGAFYAWSPAEMIQGSANQQTVMTAPLFATQTYTLSVTLDGCESSDEVTVTVNEIPTANAGEDFNIPYDTQASLTATDTGSGTEYHWSPEALIASGQGTATATTVNLTETTEFTLVVTLNNCESTDMVTVIVGDQLYATAVAEPDEICPEGTTILTATPSYGTGNYTYSWSPAELIAAGQNAATAVTTALTTTTEFTCTVSDYNETVYPTVTVSVKPLPEVIPIADNSVLCFNENTMLHSTSIPGASYAWTPADKIQGDANQPDVTTIALTETTVFTLTVTLDGCDNSDMVTVTVNELPTADAGPDFNIPFDTQASLTAIDAGPDAEYYWSPEELIQNGQGTATATTVNLTENTEFTLTVTLNGCESSTTVMVIVGDQLYASVAADPEALCPQETATLTVMPSSGTGTYEYIWEPANLIDGDNTLATVTTLPLTTTTEFTCTVNDGNEDYPAMVTVTVKPQPEAIPFADNPVLCEGMNTMLHTTAVPGADYQWSPAGMIQGNANQPDVTTIALTETTEFTVNVILDGCENNEVVTVTVNEIPTADAGPDFNIPYDTPATLTVLDAVPGAEYHWSPEALIASGQGTATATTINLTETTEFTLTVILNGCESSDMVTIVVGDQLYATVSADPNEICAGSTTNLSVMAFSGNEDYTYDWEPANLIDGDNTLETVTTLPLTETTEFTCYVSDGNELVEPKVTVIVRPQPNASATATATTLCEGTTTTLIAADAGTGASYEWTPANMIQGDTHQRVVTTIALDETTEFTLTVTLNGCEAATNITVNVNEPPIANAGADFNVPYDMPATLTASDAGPGAEYHWSPENLIASGQGTATATTINLTETTEFTLIVTLNGCEDRDVVTVVVGDQLFATASADPNEICQGAMTTLTVTAFNGGGNPTYQWEPANLIDGDNTLETVTTVPLMATTEFTCYVIDGNENVSPKVTVTVNLPPLADASGSDHETDYGAPATLIAVSAGQGAIYHWEPTAFIDGDPDQQQVTTLPLTAPTTFILTVTLNGCDASDEVTVSVGGELDVTASADPSDVCFGTPATLTATASGGTGPYNYLWEPAALIDGDNTTSTVTTVNIETDQTFTVTVTDGAGASDRIPIAVTVKPVSLHGDTTVVVHHPIEWYGEIYNTSGQYEHVIPGGNHLGCDSTVYLHLTVLPAPIGDTTAFSCGPFEWYGQTLTVSGPYSHTFYGGGYLHSDSTVLLHLTIEVPYNDTIEAVTCDQFQWYGHYITESGLYTQTFTSEHGCDSTVTLNLTVENPDLEIQGYQDVFYASDIWHGIYHYYLVDSTYSYLDTVEWHCSNPDWVILPMSDFHCVVIVRTMGMGVLTAQPSNLLGCDDQLSIEIRATEFNDYTDDEIPILVYPVPADEVVTVVAPNLLNIKVFNVLGQYVMAVPPEHNDNTDIPVKDLACGLYLLEITTSNGVYIKHIIVR